MKSFKPRTPSQKEVMENTDPCLLYCAPWFSGKTRTGAAKAYVMGAMYRSNCIGLVRKKRVDLKPTLWHEFIEYVLPDGAVIESNDTDLYRKVCNGSEFHGVGLDSTGDVNKLASRQFGFIVIEEVNEITEKDWDEKILRGLRLPGVPFHQVLGLTNAGSPMSFLYKRFYSPKLGGYKAIDGTMLPNPPPNYKRAIDSITGVTRQRFVENKWVSFEGLVYPFNPMKHVIPRSSLKISSDGRWVISVDFGYDHPFVAQFWYVSPEDVWYLYWQIYMSERRVEVHAETILERCEVLGIEPEVICDHNAENAATLRSKGIKTKRARKERLAGQQSVQKVFDEDRIYFLADSLIELDQRLLMEKKPTRTEGEFPTYTWANTAREDMVKQKDDGMDAGRYAIHTTEGVHRRVIRQGKAYA